MVATTTIPAEQLTQIGADLLQSAEVSDADARFVAVTLVDADLRGHFSPRRQPDSRIPGIA